MNPALDKILSLAEAYEQQLPDAPLLVAVPKGAELAGWIDQTLLKPEATQAEVRRFCEEARPFAFASVCIHPVHVPLTADLLAGSAVKVCTVVAFPSGAILPELKAHETRTLIEKGAAEIDMVINVGALKGRDWSLALEDIQSVVQAAAGKALVKVIFETALLTQREKIVACLLAQAAGADFVKTSTGFGPGGATVEDIALMRRVVGAGIGVKASGGIRTLEAARAMIEAGANRIGSSAGIAILQSALQGAVT